MEEIPAWQRMARNIASMLASFYARISSQFQFCIIASCDNIQVSWSLLDLTYYQSMSVPTTMLVIAKDASTLCYIEQLTSLLSSQHQEYIISCTCTSP